MVAKRIASFVAGGAKRKKPNADGTWRCPTCEQDLPADAFYSKKRSPNGLSSQCRKCHTRGAIRTRDADNHRARQRVHEANRRARMARSEGTITRGDYERLRELLGEACLRCGVRERITWDHVIPLARGGAHSPLNIQPLCRPCNETKQARDFDYRTDEQRASLAAVWVVEFKRVERKARAA